MEKNLASSECTKQRAGKRSDTETTNCDCGSIDLTMLHIVNDCPIRKFSGDIEGLHRLDERAIEWLNNLDLNL